MSTEEQRIVVCEKLFGWTKSQIDAVLALEKLDRRFYGLARRDSFSGLAIQSEYETQEKICGRLKCPANNLPPLTLDWLHECEENLTHKQALIYCVNLRRVLMNEAGVSEFDLLHAPAKPRLQALVKTITNGMPDGMPPKVTSVSGASDRT